MVKLKIKHFDHDSVAADAKFSTKWPADKDYTIKAILFKRKDGASFTATDVTIRVAGDPITLDHALVNTFGTDHLNYWPIEEPIKKAEDFEYEGVNREGVTISLVVELVLEVVGA